MARKRKSGRGNAIRVMLVALAVLCVFSLLANLIVGIGNIIRENPILVVGIIALVLAGSVISLLIYLRHRYADAHSNVSVSGFSERESRGTATVADENIDAELARKRQELLQLNDELLYQSFGLYDPKYAFSTVDGYKDKLNSVRQDQKALIRNSDACTVPNDLTYNNSLAEGKKIAGDWVKLMLRAFNGECDSIITKANFNNIEQLEARIRKSAEEISKIGMRMRIHINQAYIDLKIEELRIAYEYEQFKQREKERLRAIREEEREKAKAEKELAAARAKLEKDQTHIRTEMNALNQRLETAEASEAEALRQRIEELELSMRELDSQIEDIDQRAANARAGYVYIISNIGSFGENVYKIGVTRRLDPQERVDELGDASVPFKFDVHAFIFSTDAMKLEATLHQKFSDRRVNLVNARKEFFAVSLDEIEKEVKANHSEVVQFTRTAAAQEYRESLLIKEKNRVA